MTISKEFGTRIEASHILAGTKFSHCTKAATLC